MYQYLLYHIFWWEWTPHLAAMKWRSPGFFWGWLPHSQSRAFAGRGGTLWEAAKAGNLKAVPGLGFCHLGLWQMDASKTWLFHDPATTETETKRRSSRKWCAKKTAETQEMRSSTIQLFIHGSLHCSISKYQMPPKKPGFGIWGWNFSVGLSFRIGVPGVPSSGFCHHFRNIDMP